MKPNMNIIVLLILLIHSVNALILDNYILKLEHSISRCTENIIYNTFTKGEYITISVPSHDNSTYQENNFLIQLNLDLQWNLFTKKNIKNKPFYIHSKKSNGYIIEFLNYNQLNHTLSFLLRSNWNPHAKFIIISHKFHRKECITNATKVLATNKVTSFIILIPNNSNSTTLNIYTWFPYENQSCANVYNLTRIINRCTDGHFDKTEKIFQEKIPNNLHKCNIRVHTVIWPPYIFAPRNNNRTENVSFKYGLEIHLLNTIAQKANFNIVYMMSEEIQGYTTGIVKPLMDGTADLVIGALGAQSIRFAITDPSISYTFEQLIWCAPLANIRSMWHNIFDIFDWEIWFLLALVYVIIALLTAALAKMEENEIKSYDSVSNCFLIILAVLISASIKKPNTLFTRILFVFWCKFCLILSTIFVTYLIYFLVTPRYDFQISSQDDIINTNISYGYLPQYKSYFRDIPNQKFLNGITCTDADKCLSYVGIYRNFTFLAPKLFLQYKQNKFHNGLGESLYLFKDIYVSFPVQMYAVKGFPLIQRINNITARIVETGLMHKWEQKFQWIVETSNRLRDNTQTNNNVRPLELKQLTGIFIIYTSGVYASIICICIEIIYFKYTFKRIPFLK